MNLEFAMMARPVEALEVLFARGCSMVITDEATWRFKPTRPEPVQRRMRQPPMGLTTTNWPKMPSATWSTEASGETRNEQKGSMKRKKP